VIAEDRYVVVEKRYFVEPVVYQYVYSPGVVSIVDWSRPEGIVVVNNSVVVRGPSVVDVQTITGRTFNKIHVVKVKNKNKIEFTSDRIVAYTPDFKRVNSKVKVRNTINKPDRFIAFNDAKEKNKNRGATGNRNEGFENRKSDNSKGTDFNTGKENKGRDKSDQNRQNENKFKGNDNQKKDFKQDEQNKNQNWNKQKGNDNSGKQKGSDNSWKQKGNDNSMKQKGNQKSDNNMKSNNKSKKSGNNNKGGKKK
jgi:hypothetical protein